MHWSSSCQTLKGLERPNEHTFPLAFPLPQAWLCSCKSSMAPYRLHNRIPKPQPNIPGLLSSLLSLTATFT